MKRLTSKILKYLLAYSALYRKCHFAWPINKDGKGDLWFSLEKNNGLLICKIEDNGIGRAKAQEIERRKVSKHKSLGIKVTKERISGLFELLDYKMDVVTENLFDTNQVPEKTPHPAGTKVIISIPMKEEE